MMPLALAHACYPRTRRLAQPPLRGGSTSTLLLSAVLGAACRAEAPAVGEDTSPAPFADGEPGLEVGPDPLDLGVVPLADGAGAGTLTLSNPGNARLTLAGASVAGSGGDWSITAVPGSLAPAEEADVTVTFVPGMPGDAQATVTVMSDDPDAAAHVSRVVSWVSAPSVSLAPGQYDFGAVVEDQTVEATFTVVNLGDDDLVVGSVDLVTDEMALELPSPLPWTLAPGEGESLVVTCSTPAEAEVVRTLEVGTDDPLVPVASATLLARREAVSETCEPILTDEAGDGSDDDGDGLDCQTGVTGGVTYVFCPESVEWSDAETACREAGYDGLAAILDECEQAALEALLESAGATMTHSPWIGLTDEDAEGSWAWSDGKPAEWLDWSAGEPNGGGIDNCAHMNWPLGDGSWNDLSCWHVGYWTGFVCEGR